ncbi:hypothetical protein V493_04237 [Pseudogymnoascus sp. VKM F-4281 (FW-2241)]|nr:hypothetical protein V493_04237 [Pseudogymnoascus sp. VKM F-4281 (FW-2241)]
MAGKGQMTKPRVPKIIVVGDSGVGRTSIIIRFNPPKFISDTFDDGYDGFSTYEDHRTQIVVDGRTAILHIRDPMTIPDPLLTEYLRVHWEQQVRKADAALLVYSVTSRESFLRVTALRDAMLALPAGDGENGASGEEVGGASGSPREPPIHITLVGNKSDRNVNREVSVEEDVELARKLRISFFETSAKDGDNVEKAFHSLIYAVDGDATDEQEPAALGGDRGVLRRLARSLRLRLRKS